MLCTNLFLLYSVENVVTGYHLPRCQTVTTEPVAPRQLPSCRLSLKLLLLLPVPVARRRRCLAWTGSICQSHSILRANSTADSDLTVT